MYARRQKSAAYFSFPPPPPVDTGRKRERERGRGRGGVKRGKGCRLRYANEKEEREGERGELDTGWYGRGGKDSCNSPMLRNSMGDFLVGGAEK